MDGNGLPLAAEVTAGQRHESTQFERVMDAVRVPRRVGRPRSRPRHVAGDKGYSYDRIRRWLRRRHIGAVIPQRTDQKQRHRGRPLTFDPDRYRVATETVEIADRALLLRMAPFEVMRIDTEASPGEGMDHDDGSATP